MQWNSKMSDSESDTISDPISDDLQQLWKEAIEQCEQVEQLYDTILSQTTDLQKSLVVEDDAIMVTYKDVEQDLMDVLDSIHTLLLHDSTITLGPTLLDTLQSCEFKT